MTFRAERKQTFAATNGPAGTELKQSESWPMTFVEILKV